MTTFDMHFALENQVKVKSNVPRAPIATFERRTTAPPDAGKSVVRSIYFSGGRFRGHAGARRIFAAAR
jgi:hypothetical protein